MTADPAARRRPNHGATAAILNGSPPTLTSGVMKVSEKLATVIAQARQNGGRLGPPAITSRHAPELHAHTAPYSSTMGMNIQPVRRDTASSVPTPMRATR